ncbi:MAG: PKD domain-containing protein, partial [Bacteroidales bacterium]|nr:PKD domain-containing protein [Bacteroidales bacterium]
YSSAFTDASGTVTIPNDFLPGDVQLVVTAFNTETIYQTIENMPQAGPFITFIQAEINDENGQLDYAETTGLNISLENVGIEAGTNLTAALSCSDPLVEINTGTALFGTINSGETFTLTDAFVISIAGNIPDGHNCIFQISVTDGSAIWNYNFNLLAHAPKFEMGGYFLSDTGGNNNGKLDPGETVLITIGIENTGSSGATGVSGTLGTLSPYISIADAEKEYGDIQPGNTEQAVFEVMANIATPIGTAINFSFEMTADARPLTSTSFQLVAGQIPVLIINMDGNSNSSLHIAQSLADLGIDYDETTTISANTTLYSTIFLCLGIYNNNHVLTAAEGNLLAAFLLEGGNLYMEGGDTWAYDSQTAVHGMFGINGVSDGSGDMGNLLGQSGSFTEGFTFFYNGDNSWMDHLEATDEATVILTNQSPAYGCGVANDAGNYKTIGTSFEFGGITNSKSSRNELMQAYATFFGLLNNDPLQAEFSASPTEIATGETVYFTNFSTGAMLSCAWDFDNNGLIDSEATNPSYIYSEAGIYSVKLTIWDADGNTAEMIKENYIQVIAPSINFQPVWQTPFNPMAIYITDAKINGNDLEAGAQIGVFDIDINSGEEICVGTSTLTGVINQQDFLEIIASMNDGTNPEQANGFTPGNAFIFKYLSQNNELIEDVLYTFPFAGYDEVFTSQGSAIANLSADLLPPQQQTIQLDEGWNAVSTYLSPVNPGLPQILGGIAQQLEIIQNLNEYYQPGNNENTLDVWNYKSGYLIKTNQITALTISGIPPVDKTILLQTGWNLISVLSETDVEINNLFSENMPKVQIIKEPAGLNLFWPAMGITQLKTLKPGKAYIVKVAEGFSVSY